MYRYFDCRPRYGLFAPVHKVAKTNVPATPSPMTRSVGSTGMRLSRERSGSQESVSSMSSVTSSASRPRVRLGVSGLGNNQVHAELLVLQNYIYFSFSRQLASISVNPVTLCITVV